MRPNQLILRRLPDVLAQYGKGRSALYEDISQSLFPPPVKLGARAAAWPQHEVDAVLAARVAGRGEAELRALVRGLVDQRRTFPAAEAVSA